MTDKRFPNWDIDVEKGTIYSLKYKRYIGSKLKNGYVYVQPPKCYKHNGVHRVIWIVANQADIPEGYDVHHIDCNKQNNSIYNLELVERHVHISEHKQNISDETKRKMSEAHKGINNYFYGKHHTDETKRKISEALKGTLLNRKDLSKQVAQYTLKGELVKVWLSACECGRNGFNQGHITECCNGKRKTHKGYIWKYLNE